MAHLGTLPCTAIEASSSASTESLAVPATRTVSLTPGQQEDQRDLGILQEVLQRIEPVVARPVGHAIVCSSSTLKPPGGSPRGG